MSGQTSYGQNDGSAFIDGFNSVGVVHNDSQGYLSTSLIVTGDISDNAITSEKLAIDISYNGLFKVNNIDNASVDSQVANKKYVDDQITEIRGGVPQVTVDTLKELSIKNNAVFINPMDALCDESTCNSFYNNIPIYKDGEHLRASFVEKNVKYLDAILLDSTSIKMSVGNL
jgi:hypothetical protein